jgi:hypothetical protein
MSSPKIQLSAAIASFSQILCTQTYIQYPSFNNTLSQATPLSSNGQLMKRLDVLTNRNRREITVKNENAPIASIYAGFVDCIGWGKAGRKLVPLVGIELTTYRLQDYCTQSVFVDL